MPATATIDMDRLGAVVADTATAQGFSYQHKEAVKPLVNAGYAEANPDLVNPENEDEVATRATEAGIALHQRATALKPAAEAAKAKPTFELTADVAMPTEAEKQRRTRESKYPFDEMEVGQSFHVAQEGDTNGVTAMGSVIANARKKYAAEAKNEDGSVKMREGVRREKQEDGSTKTWKENVPVLEFSRDFKAFKAQPNDPAGAGTRVFRTA